MGKSNFGKILKIFDLILGVVLIVLGVVEYIHFFVFFNWYYKNWECWLFPLFIILMGFLLLANGLEKKFFILSYFIFLEVHLGIGIYDSYVTFLAFALWNEKSPSSPDYSWYGLFEIIIGSLFALFSLIHIIVHFHIEKVTIKFSSKTVMHA